jgi:hypothetical protein
MSAHKISPSSPRLASLLSDVEKGNIKIPVFQREFVWDDSQISSLLDSIYQGFPVGSLLLWSTKERLTYERNVGGFKLPEAPEDYPVQYILDGQQRLTTLYGVFNSSAATSNPDLASRFRICFVPVTGEFLHESLISDLDAAIYLRDILDTTKLLPELQRFSPEHQILIGRVTERFKDYEFPVVTIKERTNQEVCRVFQRINSSGTTLSSLELLAAWTWSEQFDLRNEIQSLIDRLATKGYEELDTDEIMRCLAAVVLDKVDPDTLVDINPEKLVQGMSKLKEAINAAVDFLEKDIHIKNIVFLPFPIMLVPLVRFFAENLKPSAKQLQGLRRWFWHCTFTQRYKAGTNRLVMEDLRKMIALAKNDQIFDSLQAQVDPNIFRRTWRINSTAAKAAICLLAQLHPRSLLTGAAIDLSSALSAYNAREFHHIYPKAYLGKLDITFHEANVIANICFLTSSDNKTISDSNPSDYFSHIPKEIREDVFDRALVPAPYRDGSKTFADFIGARAELLAVEAQKLIVNG